MNLKKNIERILSLKNKHEGERIFIIGTGPSLNKTNFKSIENEILFGVNTLYRGHNKFGISPQYYACSDKYVWETHDENLLQLDTCLMLTGGAAAIYRNNLDYYQTIQNREPTLLTTLGHVFQGNFSSDLLKGVYNGDTIVVDICLQASLYMGFDRIYLLGCDSEYREGEHRFDGLRTENINGGGVTNHWEKAFTSFAVCKEVYKYCNTEIINCTVGGRTEIFKREKLENVLKNDI